MVHLVHFWLKEEYKTPEKLAEFEAALDKLCSIPLASQSQWGRPAAVKDRPSLENSWDYNTVSFFGSVEVHDEYQVHPVHLEFLEQCKPFWEKAMVIDSELND